MKTTQVLHFMLFRLAIGYPLNEGSSLVSRDGSEAVQFTKSIRPGGSQSYMESPDASVSALPVPPMESPDDSEAGIDWEAAVKQGQELIDQVKAQIVDPNPSGTYISKDTYSSAISDMGMQSTAAARTNSGLPVREASPEVQAFFNDITGGSRPFGKDATLYVHEVRSGRLDGPDGPVSQNKPVFSAYVTANKQGALIMASYDAVLFEEIISSKSGGQNVFPHQHFGVAAEFYGATGNPKPIKYLASTDVTDEDAKLVMSRVAAGGKFGDPKSANRFRISLGGAGEEGDRFRELAATPLGSVMMLTAGDYHVAYGNTMPVAAHIYYDKEGTSGNYIIWELGSLP